MPDNDPIRHVIMLIMENRSFDHMMGGMAGVLPGLDGVDPQHPHVNFDPAGQAYYQAPSQLTQTASDPKHEHADVVIQLQNQNSGFVLDFAQQYPASTVQDRQQIMAYFPADFLPGLHSLAHDFTVCDRWYSSVPGPTWPNRFFALSGTSLGRILMPTGVTDLGGLFPADPADSLRPPQPGRQELEELLLRLPFLLAPAAQPPPRKPAALSHD